LALVAVKASGAGGQGRMEFHVQSGRAARTPNSELAGPDPRELPDPVQK